MPITKKIALVTGGNIHNSERETPLNHSIFHRASMIDKALTDAD
jgi:hypothetical protein